MIEIEFTHPDLTQQEGELLNLISIRKNHINKIWWEWSNTGSGMICHICDKLFNIKRYSDIVFIKHARRHINESNLKVFL